MNDFPGFLAETIKEGILLAQQTINTQTPWCIGGHLGFALGTSGILPPFGSDDYWLAQALISAMRSPGRALPNPTVGAVIVKDQSLIAHGATAAIGGYHAERTALAQATPEQVRNATLYVTLEPCNHHGRQPPCSDAIIAAGIKRCVVGTMDPHPLVAGEGIRRLKEAGITVTTTHNMAAACAAWHLDFTSYVAINKDNSGDPRPAIFAKWAQSLDGCMADDHNTSKWLTSASARAYGHWLRQKYDAIMVGAGTVLADFPQLSSRDCPQITRQPTKIIVDPKGQLTQASPGQIAKLKETTFAAATAQPVIILTSSAIVTKLAKSWLAALPRKPLFASLQGICTNKPLGDIALSLSAPEIRQYLGQPLTSVYTEGGPRLISHLIANDSLAGIHAFIAPKILGGSRNRPLATTPLNLEKAKNYQMIGCHRLGPDTLIELQAPLQAPPAITPSSNQG